MKAFGAHVLAAAITIASSDAAAGKPGLAVHHDNSLQGLSALFAVRACIQSYQDLVLDVTEPGLPQEVIVQLFDAQGNEVGRHVGSKGVCGFARYAFDYIRLDGSALTPAPVEPTGPAAR